MPPAATARSLSRRRSSTECTVCLRTGVQTSPLSDLAAPSDQRERSIEETPAAGLAAQARFSLRFVAPFFHSRALHGHREQGMSSASNRPPAPSPAAVGLLLRARVVVGQGIFPPQGAAVSRGLFASWSRFDC